jgi:hypothetical protein
MSLLEKDLPASKPLRPLQYKKGTLTVNIACLQEGQMLFADNKYLSFFLAFISPKGGPALNKFFYEEIEEDYRVTVYKRQFFIRTQYFSCKRGAEREQNRFCRTNS